VTEPLADHRERYLLAQHHRGAEVAQRVKRSIDAGLLHELADAPGD
jgi:hypothetical protein